MANKFGWQRIVKKLTSDIMSGAFKSSEKFHTIKELSQIYSVSDITSRRVLDELSQAKLIKKIQGKGSFVVKSSFDRVINLVVPQKAKMPNLQNDIIYMEMLRGIISECEDEHVKLITSSSPPATCVGERKLILLIHEDEDMFRSFNRDEYVCVHAHTCEPIEGISTIRSDYEYGAYLAVSHLLSLGHRRIGFITGRMSKWSSLRFDGYHKAFKEMGVNFDLQLIKETNASKEQDEQAIIELLSLPKPVTAVFTVNDLRALHLLEYCQENSVKVPDDLAVAGFDNVYESSVSSPPLTTVDTFWRKHGKKSVELLLDLASQETPETTDIVLQPELLIREST